MNTRKSMMKLSLGLCAALALATTTFDASAAGLAVDSSELAAKSRSSLKADIEKARTETPDLFRQVYDIAKRAGELDAGARRQGTPLTMHFKVLGNRALMPMLELLAFDGHAPADLTPSARDALRVGLIEAVGIVRDARAVPVLARIALRERDVDTTHASADALGRIGTDEAFTALVTALDAADAATPNGERVQALLAGVGSSRRVDGTKLLAKRLDAHPDTATAKAAVKALGVAGNAWAWKTLASRTDEATVRELAARALVKAYLSYGGEVRTAATNALLVVDDAHTSAIVTEARRAATTDQATLLDDLATKLAKNPTR
ncbi:MAG: hypothetical protein JWP87_1757 [Labilithrix sp.]|jgi:hypothetical protein|nr:hypothetical protein [Labilithrix sp.]